MKHCSLLSYFGSIRALFLYRATSTVTRISGNICTSLNKNQRQRPDGSSSLAFSELRLIPDCSAEQHRGGRSLRSAAAELLRTPGSIIFTYVTGSWGCRNL